MAPSTVGVSPYDPDYRRTWLDLPFPRDEYEGRLARVRSALRACGLERLLLCGAPRPSGNARWLAHVDSFVGPAMVTVPASGAPRR